MRCQINHTKCVGSMWKLHSWNKTSATWLKWYFCCAAPTVKTKQSEGRRCKPILICKCRNHRSDPAVGPAGSTIYKRCNGPDSAVRSAEQSPSNRPDVGRGAVSNIAANRFLFNQMHTTETEGFQPTLEYDEHDDLYRGLQQTVVTNQKIVLAALKTPAYYPQISVTK
jgi:hypothetical protein